MAALSLIVLLSACAQNQMPTPVHLPTDLPPKAIIFDGDMAQEDMFAALFLLQNPNVDVRAITVAGAGEAHCAPGVKNLRGLVALVGRPEIPVACGRETPLAGSHAFPDEWRLGADGAYGVSLPPGQASQPERTASELIAQVLRDANEPVTLVATGPLTNIADAILEHADLLPKIEMIYVMGGAVNVPGNLHGIIAGHENSKAEWNIYIDPAAAGVVLNSGAPVTLIPLDATRHVPVTRAFYKKLGSWRDTPAAQFTYAVLTTQLDFIDTGGFQFWDSFTAALAIDETLAKFETHHLVVVEEEGPESGWTKPSTGGAAVRVATWGDAERYEALLLTVLNYGSPSQRL